MLKNLRVKGFKSIADVELALPKLTVLFGPNAVGKSNFLDAIQALSRIGTLRTISDALSEPIRGYPIESFSFPSGGLQELLAKDRASFELGADLEIKGDVFRYEIGVEIEPLSGRLTTSKEYLALLNSKGDAKGRASIERVNDQIHIRRKSKPAHPRQEEVGGMNHSILSDTRFSGREYPYVEKVRSELSGWRVYYLDPRVAMRQARPPLEVSDVGVLGGEIAPFLHRLQAEHPKNFQAVVRALRSLIPSVESLSVELDKRRGTLDLQIRQSGIDYSARIVSEGTLRVLALCAIAVNPWGTPLVSIEEPENGVHPRRLELIAELLLGLASESGRQVVVTSHSPLFCASVLREARNRPGDIGLFNVRRSGELTYIRRFDVGPLFADEALREALTSSSEDGLFQALVLRGMLDE